MLAARFAAPAAVLSAMLLASHSPAVVYGGDWPTFRGPDRTGVSTETGLLQEWPKEGPPLVWKADGVGRGYSSLAIAGGRIYTLGDGITSAENKDEYLLA